MKNKTVDFGYSFHTPHAITLSRPSASEKTAVDVYEGMLVFTRPVCSLKNAYPLSWTEIPKGITMNFGIAVDGKPARFEKWHRHESGAPFLFCEGSDDGLKYEVSAISGKQGVIIKVISQNHSEIPHSIYFQVTHTSGWVISNWGWIDGIHDSVLMTMNNGRADRLLLCAYGADSYPMYRGGLTAEGETPMVNSPFGINDNSMKKVTAKYSLNSGEEKIGYFFMPHEMYSSDIDKIGEIDFDKEMSKSLAEWKRLLERSARISIADEDVMHCFSACLADLFVMREKIGRYTGITCGTRVYRSSNSGEPLEAEILLDTLGYTKEAENDYRMYLEGQELDGCWVSRKGWEHECWGVAFNKANAVMEHYYITRDREFLEKYYPRMLASTIFQYNSRRQTKNSPAKSERGLMPRGMGDCGLMNNGDYYGVFYPHNCQSVAADGKTLEAAKLLGMTEDIPLLTKIYEEGRQALLTSIRGNLAEIDGYKIVPPTANAAVTSMYGALFALFPCELVSWDDPIITDTVRYIEDKQISEGGLPVGMGWQKEGLWVAMALSNLSRSYLRTGFSGEAHKYFYPALNHASPLVTWCEERGAEKDSTVTSGDRQHLWTPLSVCQYLTEALFFEDGEAVHILAGICPEWLEAGKEISVSGYRSHYGKTDFKVKNTGGDYLFEIKTEREIEKDIILHLPGELRRVRAR